MKLLRLLSLLMVFGCAYVAPPPSTTPKTDNEDFLEKTSNDLKKLGLNSIQPTIAGDNYGSKVDMYNEMLELFDPDKLNCNLSDRLRSRLKESKRMTKEKNGYVPDIVVNNVSEYKDVIKVADVGANILLHYFTYQKSDGKESDPITPMDLPTQRDFEIVYHIDNQPQGYESFFFTMDCAGFFSASVKAAVSGGFLGFGRGSIASEGEGTINQDKSILVIKALLRSPLYAAFDGSHIFKITPGMTIDKKKEVLNHRVVVLEGILDAIPINDQVDDRKVYLNANYESVITSNKGNSGFNGTGKLNTNIDLALSSTQAGAQIKNSISRKSEYENFDSYIIKANRSVALEDITVKRIKDKISEIKTQVTQL